MSTEAAKVVALLGRAGSGKSIVVRRMLEAGFHRVRFGDAARDMLVAGFGCSPHEIDGDDRERPQRRFGGYTAQHLMQSLLHDWGRFGVHPDLWDLEWARRIEPLTGFVVTDDVHRPHEAQAVRDRGGIIVRVTRHGYIPQGKKARSGHNQDRIAADLELINEGPEKLAAATDKFLEGLLGAAAAA